MHQPSVFFRGLRLEPSFEASRTDLSESFIDDVGVLEVIIREEIELIEEIPYIYTAQWVHLGERKNAWEAEINQC